MKKLYVLFGALGVSAGFAGAAVSATNGARATSLVTNSALTTTNSLRGTAAQANAYLTNQRNTYFMVTQPDVDTACRQKIYKCLADYCGDVTIVPGQNNVGENSRCRYASESDLYNYALLCLQKDTSILLPQYTASVYSNKGGVNTAAQLCPSYVQQELMSYLSMANMANQLSRSHSDLCVQRRQELEAAMSCHSVALAYGNETTSKLTAYLTDYCGAGVPGGSVEMVSRFANAGNVGANIWGWAEKIVSLDLNKKGEDWQAAVDAVLAGYTNRMNVACGDDLKINTVPTVSSSEPSTLQTAAVLLLGAKTEFPDATQKIENPYESWSVYMEVKSNSELWDYDTAKQVVNAGLTNSALTQNAFLSSAQMDSMQTAYKRGTKVFIIRDSARCYMIPVQTLTQTEATFVAQSFANCVSK